MKKVYAAPKVKTEPVMLGVFGLFGSYGRTDCDDRKNDGGYRKPQKRGHQSGGNGDNFWDK